MQFSITFSAYAEVATKAMSLTITYSAWKALAEPLTTTVMPLIVMEDVRNALRDSTLILTGDANKYHPLAASLMLPLRDA